MNSMIVIMCTHMRLSHSECKPFKHYSKSGHKYSTGGDPDTELIKPPSPNTYQRLCTIPLNQYNKLNEGNVGMT